METILIDIGINDNEVAKKLAEVNASISALKEANKGLKKDIKESGDATGAMSAQLEKNNAQIKSLTATQKSFAAQIQYNDKENRKYGDSFKEQAARLAQLKNEYSGLTKAQRESAEGQALLKNLQSLDKQVKANNASMGQFQMNVGNYTSAFGKFGGVVGKVGGIFAGGFKQGITTAGKAVVKFGVQLLATPLGWILGIVAAVIAIFKQLAAAFKKSDDASTNLHKALSIFKPLIEAVSKLFEKLALVISKAALAVAHFVSGLLGKLIPGYKASQKAAEEWYQKQDELQDRERAYTVNSAKRQAEIAKINNKIRTDETLTAQQKIDLAAKADDLEQKNLEEAKKNAEDEYNLLVQKNKEKRKVSDADKDAEAQALAKMHQVEQEYWQGTTRLQTRAMAARKELQKEQDDADKERAEKWKKALETQKSILQQLEDEEVNLIKDGTKKAEEALKLRYTREIDKLKEQLKKNEGLTVDARENLNKLILLKEKEFQDALSDLKTNTSKENAKKEADEALKLQQHILNQTKLQYLDNQERITEAELNFSKIKLNTLKSYEDGKWSQFYDSYNNYLLAVDAAEADLVDKTKAHNDALAKAAAEGVDKNLRDINDRIMSALDESDSTEMERAEAQLEIATEQYEYLATLDDDLKEKKFKNLQEWEKAVKKAADNVNKAQAGVYDVQIKHLHQAGEAAAGFSDAINNVLNAVAGDSEEFAVFQKALAVVNLTINAAEAIVSAVRTASEMPGDPYTLAIRIAAAAAAVTAAIAGIISTVKAAEVPPKPSFAGGGIVEGTSYFGDNVPVMANSGEMILTPEQQARLFNIISGSENAVSTFTIDYTRLAEVMTRAFASMPPPVMVYTEYQQFKKRLEYTNKLTK